MITTILLSIEAIAIFFIGAYYMGNWFTQASELRFKLLSIFVGMFCWGAVAIVILICMTIFNAISSIV